MKSIIRELIEFIMSCSKELNLPAVIAMDYLPSKGDALSFQSDMAPKLEKAYIGGTKQYAMPFTILASTDGATETSVPNITAVGWLEALGSLFEGMCNYRLSESRTIIKGETMTPAIITRTESNRLVYAISISIKYQEE